MRRDIAGHVGEIGDRRALGSEVRMVRSGTESRGEKHRRNERGKRERANRYRRSCRGSRRWGSLLGDGVGVVRLGIEERLRNYGRISAVRRERAKTCVDEFEVNGKEEERDLRTVSLCSFKAWPTVGLLCGDVLVMALRDSGQFLTGQILIT